MNEPWPQSKKANVGEVAMRGTLNTQNNGNAPTNDIQMIANMMDQPQSSNPQPANSKITISGNNTMLQDFQTNVSPDDAAKLMITNYVNSNGGVILD